MKKLSLTSWLMGAALLAAPGALQGSAGKMPFETGKTAARKHQPPALRSWAEWTEKPLTVPLMVEFNALRAASNTPVAATLNRKTVVGYGGTNGCWDTTNAPPLVSSLSVRRNYRLTVVASNLNSMELKVGVIPPWQLLAAKGPQAVPKVYQVLIDGQPGDTIPLSGSCDYYSNSWNIVVQDQRPAQWQTDDQSDDPRPAPGDGTGLAMGPGRSLETNKTAIDWSVGLGRLYDGLAAGRLRLREDGITRELFTPELLYYTATSTNIRGQVDLVSTNFEGTLRQVRAYQTFVDILAPSTNQTALNFYYPSQVLTNKDENGIYTNITGSPFVSWLIQNPEPATTNKLLLIESRNGVNQTNSLVCSPQSQTETWVLTTGSGAAQRVETRGVVFSYSPGTNRTETVSVRYAGSTTNAIKTIEKYHLYDWDWELVEVRDDPDSTNLVTTFDFYQDPNDKCTYSQFKSARYPDGSWEKRVYYPDDAIWYLQPPGALWHVLRPYQDLPAGPDDALPENSFMTEYVYDFYDPATHVKSQYGGTPNYSIDYSPSTNWFGLESVYRSLGNNPAADQYRLQKTWAVDDARQWTRSSTTIGGEARGKGVTDHVLESWGLDPAPVQVNCFHGGVYDPAGETFTVGTNGPAGGPDWRQTTVFYGPRAQDDYAYWGEGLSFSTLEGQPVGSGLGASPVFPYRNWKETRVYQGGSLVQREVAVYTGNDSAGEPQFETCQRFVYRNDTLGHPTNIVSVDVANPVIRRTTYQADYRGEKPFDGDLLLWETDETGIRQSYEYDGLKRVVKTTRTGCSTAGYPSQVDVVTTVTLDAAGRKLQELVSGGGLSATNRWVYDLSGRVVKSVDAQGLTTQFDYLDGGKTVMTRLPSTAMVVTENYAEGRLHSRTGNGVVNEFHDYLLPDLRGRMRSATDLMDPALIELVHYGTESSARWKRFGLGYLGRAEYDEAPDCGSTNLVLNTYQGALTGGGAPWASDRPACLVRPGRATEWYAYNLDGSLEVTATALPGEGHGPDSRARITSNLKRFLKQGTAWFAVETNLTFLADNSAAATVTGVRRERLSGFSSASTLSEVTSWDADTNCMVVTATVDRAARKVTQVVTVDQSSLSAVSVAVNGLPQTETSLTMATPAWHYFDALGRETRVVNPQGFAASTTYNDRGQVVRTTDFTGNSVQYEYYPDGVLGAGQVKSETRANGRKTSYNYTARGEVCQTWGDVPYPEERIYSAYGELAELRTFRGGSGWNGSAWPTNTTGAYDQTTWVYDGPSGILLAKRDHSGHGATYAYTNAMLLTRSWARSAGGQLVTVTNLYNEYGDLCGLAYSDGTPGVALTNFSRAGLPRGVVDGSGASELAYDHAGRLTLSTSVDGLLAGVAVSNHFNGLNGRDSLRVLGVSPGIDQRFGYDSYGRLGSVSSGVFSATYGYLQDSDLLRTTICRSNNSTVLTTTRSWEYGMRLGAIVNEVDGVNVSSHAYQYDPINRRTRAALEDGSLWMYEYNDRDELAGARRCWPDWAPVAGQQFGYTFDNIGSRVSARWGGDTQGGNLRETVYTANSLNQYTDVQTPGYKPIAGVALATNSVTVNGAIADRKVEHFHREVTVANSSGPVWQNVEVISATATNGGGFVCPKGQQPLTYDLDGNLSFDGVWVYEWDGENRLRSMTMTNVSGIPNAQRKRLEFAYDFMSRRVGKTVKTWTGSSFGNAVSNRFIYDLPVGNGGGWNVIAVLGSQPSVLQSFLWGQDLSGTMSGAGGVGGLLAVCDQSTINNQPSTHFAAYDGNGNIMGLINAGDRSTSARYEYSPFGELLRSTGSMGEANALRFSTRFHDDEGGFVYYGYRYYSPSLGRWISRDPVEENGGLNLYGFICNRVPAGVDILGKTWWDADYGFGDDFWSWAHDESNPIGLAKAGMRHPPREELDALYDHYLRLSDGGKKKIGPKAGGWKVNGRRPPKGGFGALDALAVIAVAMQLSQADTQAQALVDSVQDVARFQASGDQGFADLAAIDVAINVQDIVGDMWMTYVVLDILLQ